MRQRGRRHVNTWVRQPIEKFGQILHAFFFLLSLLSLVDLMHASMNALSVMIHAETIWKAAFDEIMTGFQAQVIWLHPMKHGCPAAARVIALEYEIPAALLHKYTAHAGEQVPQLPAITERTGAETVARFGLPTTAKY